MKIAIISDCHLKNLKDSPDNFAAVEHCLNYSSSQNIKDIFFAGDVFDDNYNSYADFENLARKFSDLTLYLLRGNHDFALSQNQFAAKNIRVIETPQISEFENKVIYLIPYVENKYAADLIESLNKQNLSIYKPKILISHCDYISDQSEVNELEKNVYMPLFKKDVEPFDKVFLGHIHKKKIIDDKVYYCGSSFPAAIDEIGERFFLIYDLLYDIAEYVKIPTKKVYYAFELCLNPFENIDITINKYLIPFLDQISSLSKETTVCLNLNLKGYVFSKKETIDNIAKTLNEKKITPIIKDADLRIFDSNKATKLKDIFVVYDMCLREIERLNLSNLYLNDKSLINDKILDYIVGALK